MLWSLAVPRLPEICKDFPGRCYFPILTAFALLHLDGLSMRNELPITYSTRTQCRSPAVSCVEPDVPLWQRQVFACRSPGILRGPRGCGAERGALGGLQGPFRAGVQTRTSPSLRVLGGEGNRRCRLGRQVPPGRGDSTPVSSAGHALPLRRCRIYLGDIRRRGLRTARCIAADRLCDLLGCRQSSCPAGAWGGLAGSASRSLFDCSAASAPGYRPVTQEGLLS